jgi:hypothetical protein
MLWLAEMHMALTCFPDLKMQTHSYLDFKETEGNQCTQRVEVEQGRRIFIRAIS